VEQGAAAAAHTAAAGPAPELAAEAAEGAAGGEGAEAVAVVAWAGAGEAAACRGEAARPCVKLQRLRITSTDAGLHERVR
jgi:hypothetical protein